MKPLTDVIHETTGSLIGYARLLDLIMAGSIDGEDAAHMLESISNALRYAALSLNQHLDPVQKYDVDFEHLL